ncbi:metal ABC transporter ATP-binding protein [Aureibacillus halotolerans]|uniref:Zinc transport system ATP-binding protein n=1 Tax=Aureibacillus halotolerans TaxID=1508390 RepID=A0A4R6UF32_9BACI|nr:metal ABC transporter ATP-binding protein [Aureibacillus halotolerans]TDQ41714.1 zinc transport system ATP-binding protein [Aureibacillus halotolerans]
MNTTPVLSIDQLSFRYNDVDVLRNISLTIPDGAFMALVGPNGSGKSTLIKLILNLLPSSARSQIQLFGVSAPKFKEWNKVGYISQKANSFNSGFPATVREVVSMGLVSKVGFFQFMNKANRQRIEEAVEAVDMTSFIDKNIALLSGGQQQRVFIARALVSDPKLLILDEPTVGVDAAHVDSFYRLLETLNKDKGMTLLMVSHDIGTMTKKATHLACLNRELHFHGEMDTFNKLDDEVLSQFYGHAVHAVSHDHGGLA